MSAADAVNPLDDDRGRRPRVPDPAFLAFAEELPPPDPDPADLPIPDYDHLPGVAVAGRAQSLGPVELELLVRYESGHRGRTPVIRQLTRLLRQQRSREAATAPPGGYGPVPSPASRPGPSI